jgi:hypothetical protein
LPYRSSRLPPSEAQQSSVQCKPAAALQRVAELPEGSGPAASRRTPGRFWSHNDSGEPVLFALDGKGRVIGRLTVSVFDGRTRRRTQSAGFDAHLVKPVPPDAVLNLVEHAVNH